MPTTDGDAAVSVLAALRSADVDFAVLHGSERLARPGSLSDVDTVVGSSPRSTIDRARGELARRGMFPVLVWPYDIGGSSTVFLTDDRATSGVQLDMLHDPEGLGRYRIRSEALLSGSHASDGTPTVADTDRLIYLWVKRRSKRQDVPLGEVEASLQALAPEAVSEAAHRIVTRTDWIEEITGNVESSRTGRWSGAARRTMLQGRRVAWRLAAPIGFWAHLPGDEANTAARLAERFDRVLVRAKAVPAPGGHMPWPWYAREVVPVRLRPGLVVSYGARPRWVPAPDLVLDDTPVDLDEIAARLVAAMSARLAR